MTKIKITIEQELSAEDINDLVSTALEGGINYWCRKATVSNVPKEAEGKYEFASDVVSLGGTLKLYDAESSDKWELDLQKMIKGITKHCTECGKTPEELMDDYDAGDADSIVQYALFDKLVFG